METERKLKLLQAMYAGVIADAVLRMGREGILEKVTEDKKSDQMKVGKMQAAQIGITSPREVFEVLPEVFGCANWKVTDKERGFSAEATGCMLCIMARRMGAQSPCRAYCLNPMEAMVKGIDPDAGYDVKETLWDGQRCRVDVTPKRPE